MLPIPATAVARSREIGDVVEVGEALSDEQAQTAISLCSGRSIDVESLVDSLNFPGRFYS